MCYIAAWYFFPIWAQAVIVSFLQILENETLSHIIADLSSIKTFDTVKYVSDFYITQYSPVSQEWY